MNNKVTKSIFLGIFASLAIVLAYIELLIPPLFSAAYGIKMGLPNIAIIFALYKFGAKEAIVISSVRLLAVALLFGNIVSFTYSIVGAILSLSLMILLKRVGLFSAIGVSIVGGISHNLGQVLTAIAMFGRIEIGYYMIVLAITGTIAGALVGLAGSYLVKALKKFKIDG